MHLWGASDWRTAAYVVKKCWRIVVRCDRCGREAGWRNAEILAAFPAEATLGEIAARLRCSCGSTDGSMSLRQDHDAAIRRPPQTLDEVAAQMRAEIAECERRRGARVGSG